MRLVWKVRCRLCNARYSVEGTPTQIPLLLVSAGWRRTPWPCRWLCSPECEAKYGARVGIETTT